MTILAIETSCDETSAAVVRDGRILSNVVSSQTGLHAEYGGVVPELAAREHLRNLIPVAKSALREAGISTAQLDAVAATQGPGLPNALLVGFKAAQAVAFALDKPFVGINHHEAHLYSPWISGEPSAADFSKFQPNISLIVSGGHTMIVLVESELKHRVLGSTIDDAAGECFDKTGKMMGLAYPAGPEIDRLAEQGNPAAFDFPRPLINDASDDFSFSGLKTSVRYFLRDNPALLDDAQKIRDLCASVQAAIVEVLVKKTIRAAKRNDVHCVTASGGVTCNRVLRQELTRACEREGFQLRLAEKSLCTDNAAMIGILAGRKLLQQVSLPSLDEEIKPGWALA
ncbi:MAG TPA: tRNA (adenosine(37)-N6)-threonylcarbamoyltransferase complex transferase subunit TsaD [Verrucomicrobiae bacterium]|jgi:N6-L-threonylcarbamoyladenine synthase|nr:tRNA (adenosine(37)-N6)-threonylcarbamoyltransferase complex transferase subunit TsaD [Verrucomicrobiae bacterium]